MSLFLHAITPWTAAAAEALVAATWQGLILATCFALCLRLAPGLSPGRRSLLWMAVFLAVVLLHFAPLALPAQAMLSSAADARLRISPAWSLALVCAWALLSASRAAHLVSGAFRLRRLALSSIPVNGDDACHALLLSGRRPVKLCLSSEVDRPSVIGFRSPRILLPPALFASLSAAELEQVLLHEMEHLRRADDWTNLLQKLALVLFPLNPVLLWIERRLCLERELACDDGVLRQTHARKAYAACLATLAEHSLLQRGASLALGAWEKRSELSRRVYRILRQPETGLRGSQSSILTALLAVALLGGTGELARSPALVRFTATAAPGPAQASLADVSLPKAPSSLRAPQVSRAVMVRATMPMAGAHASPAPRAASAVLVRPRRHAASRMPRIVMTRTIMPSNTFQRTSEPASSARVLSNAPWLLLSSWEPDGQPGSTRLTLRNGLLPSYAAVPVADGWLIIQL